MAALTKLAALGVTAVLAVTATGCGSRPRDPAGADRHTLVMGTAHEVVHLDPAGSYDPGSETVIRGLYQSLLTVPAGAAAPRPDAARSCHWQNRDRTAYACTLRTGLTFSNGHRLTATDVKYSFDRIRRIAAPTGPRPLLAGLRSTEAPSARRVVFHLDAPDATFPSKLATGAGAVVDHRVFPADRLLPDRKVVGSGRYTLAGLRDGTVRLAASSSYRGAGRPRNTTVVIRHYDTPDAAATALRAGRVDLTDRLAPTDIMALHGNAGGGVRLHEGPATRARYLAFNTRDRVTGKAAVRRAVAALVDRRALAANVYRKTVDPLHSLIPAGTAGHASAYSDAYPAPDPARARTLLRDAGLNPPVKLDYAWSGNPSGRAEAAELKHQLERDGLFRVDLREMSLPRMLKAQSAGTLQVYDIGWAPDFPDADNTAAPLLAHGGAYHTGWNSRRVTEELLPEEQAEPDRAEAATRFAAIDAVAARDVPLLPLWQDKQYIATSGKLAGTGRALDASNIVRYWRISRSR